MFIMELVTNSLMKSVTKSEMVYRVILLLVALEAQIQLQIEAFLNTQNLEALARWKYLTNQSNLLGIIWLGAWISWRNDPLKLKRLGGKFHGAVVSYLTLVMLAYHFLLSKGDPGFWIHTNLIVHYIVPTGFLIGWIIWEREKIRRQLSSR